MCLVSYSNFDRTFSFKKWQFRIAQHKRSVEKVGFARVKPTVKLGSSHCYITYIGVKIRDRVRVKVLGLVCENGIFHVIYILQFNHNDRAMFCIPCGTL